MMFSRPIAVGKALAIGLLQKWIPLAGIRIAGNRSQVWLNNRVYSDQVRDGGFAAGVLRSGVLRSSGSELRNIRIRKL